MNVQFDCTDDVVLVTGAAGALGSATASAFADAGATVVGTDLRSPDHDEALVDPTDVDAFHEADLTDESAVERVIDAVIDEFGHLDVLCNIAGTWRGGSPIHETDGDQFDFLFDVNLRTVFLASKHAVPHLRDSGGAIVSVSARSSLSGGAGDGLYRASKAGVRLLTETLADENRGDVRANAIMPSVLDTPMNRSMMTPSEDWVDPADVAATILVLCSDATSVTSGAAVPVYGTA